MARPSKAQWAEACAQWESDPAVSFQDIATLYGCSSGHPASHFCVMSGGVDIQNVHTPGHFAGATHRFCTKIWSH
jgi:hypothetical protein